MKVGRKRRKVKVGRKRRKVKGGRKREKVKVGRKREKQGEGRQKERRKVKVGRKRENEGEGRHAEMAVTDTDLLRGKMATMMEQSCNVLDTRKRFTCTGNKHTHGHTHTRIYTPTHPHTHARARTVYASVMRGVSNWILMSSQPARVTSGSVKRGMRIKMPTVKVCMALCPQEGELSRSTRAQPLTSIPLYIMHQRRKNNKNLTGSVNGQCWDSVS